jgi:hypothetical protein
VKKIDRFSNIFVYFHVFQVVEHIRYSFRTITLTKSRVYKKNRKVQFWVNFCHFFVFFAKKNVYGFFCAHFWVNKSLSMMCRAPVLGAICVES